MGQPGVPGRTAGSGGVGKREIKYDRRQLETSHVI